MELPYNNVISTEKELRSIMGYPADMVIQKAMDHIDVNCRLFIEESPFIIISTCDKNGNLDASPKGDPPGFVKILNNRTLAIPDRKGNNRADTLTNILQNPKVGLIFLIPGIKETLRVNGMAHIVQDEQVLQLLSHKNSSPNLALIISVEEAFIHCTKCMIRSKLWTNTKIDSKRKVPTLAKSLVDHAGLEMTYEEMDKLLKEDEKTGLY